MNYLILTIKHDKNILTDHMTISQSGSRLVNLYLGFLVNQGALNHHLSQVLTPTPLDNCQDIVNISSAFHYFSIKLTETLKSWPFPTRFYHPSLYYLQRISCSPLWGYNRSKGWRQRCSRMACRWCTAKSKGRNGLVCGDAWSNCPSTRNVAYRGISAKWRLKWPFSSGKNAVWSVSSCNHTSEGSTCSQYKILHYSGCTHNPSLSAVPPTGGGGG